MDVIMREWISKKKSDRNATTHRITFYSKSRSLMCTFQLDLTIKKLGLMEITYDLSEVREMSGNDEAFVQEMLDAFLTNNRSYLDDLNKCFKEKNWKQVKFFAHKIKPSILLFKIDALKVNILELNDYAGNETNLEKIPALVEELNNGLEEVFGKISHEKK